MREFAGSTVIRHCHSQKGSTSTIRIKDLLSNGAQEGKDVQKVNGWITNVRKMKNVTFLHVNDGSCGKDLQIVVDRKLDSNFNVGSSIKVSGVLGQTPKGQVELQAKELNLVNTCKYPEYPLTPKQQHPPEYLRQFLHLRSRHKPFASTMRIRHAAHTAFHNYLDQNGFLNIHTPIMTSNDCEDSGEVFLVRPENEALLKEMQRENVSKESAYFDKKSFLTVSGQLHLESMCMGLDKVYTFNPAFRAENCRSPCHLAEFYMLEAEVAFMENLKDVIGLVENMIKHVTKDVLNKNPEDLIGILTQNKSDYQSIDKELTWIDKEIPIVTYSDAIEILKNHSEEIKIQISPNEGIVKEHELFLAKHFNGPCFLVHFPLEFKPFYMKQNKEHPNVMDCFDLLVPNVGELVGGSVREHNLDCLKNKIPNADELEWYLDLRKYGSACTSGFGMGFERYLQWILHVKNIRDVIPFPRWAHHCDT